ncbi:MAG: HEAT repeat domain-containing protein [Minicystis sp.]
MSAEATVPTRPEPPVRRKVPVYAEALERLLLSLRALPSRVDREPIKVSIESALAALAQLGKSEIDHADHLELFDRAAAAITLVREARAAAADHSEAARRADHTIQRIEASLAADREATIDAIVENEQRALRNAPAAEPKAARPFRASIGVPAIHALDRGPVTPLVDVTPVLAEDEIDESPKRNAKALPQGNDAELLQIQRLARGALENVAICSSLRRTNEGEPWSAAARFEQRLLAALDAIVSLSFVERGADRRPDVVEQVLRYAAEATFADPGRAFARAFVLGCIEGDDTMRALLLGFRQSHDYTYAAQREALSLASSPAIVPAMERLLWDEDPTFVRIALEVLRFRRKATFAAVAPLLQHPDPDVLEAAARCLGAVEPRGPAREALVQMFAEAPLDRVCLAAAESLLRLRSSAGLVLVVRALEEEDAHPGILAEDVRQGYVRLLALAGAPAHADLLLRSVLHESSGATAIGWFGHVGLLDPLLRKLAAANDVRQMTGPYATPFEVAAAEALVRITGVYVENPNPLLDVGICVDAAVWQERLEERRKRMDPGLKYRFGAPYTPLLSLEEISDESAPVRVRENATLELTVAADLPERIEITDWVARQHAALHAMGARLVETKDAYPPGGWPAHHLDS